MIFTLFKSKVKPFNFSSQINLSFLWLTWSQIKFVLFDRQTARNVSFDFAINTLCKNQAWYSADNYCVINLINFFNFIGHITSGTHSNYFDCFLFRYLNLLFRHFIILVAISPDFLEIYKFIIDVVYFRIL